MISRRSASLDDAAFGRQAGDGEGLTHQIVVDVDAEPEWPKGPDRLRSRPFEMCCWSD
jgi:hypothetical protein